MDSLLEVMRSDTTVGEHGKDRWGYDKGDACDVGYEIDNAAVVVEE